MKRLRLLWHRLAGVLLRTRRENELASEIENHIAWQTEDNIRAGMSPEAARRAALVKFGVSSQSRRSIAISAAYRNLRLCCKTCALLCARLASAPVSLR